LKQLARAPPAGLKWTQRSSKQDELASDKDIFGIISWSTWWSSLATAQSAEGRWTFKRVGFLHQRITVREPGREANLCVVQVAWNGEATLNILGRGAFRWVPNVWHRRWVLRGPDDKEVMNVTLSGFVNVSGAVRIDSKWLSDPMLPLLALLGWYLIMLVVSEDATVTASYVAVA
jgi:hypothetical protein